MKYIPSGKFDLFIQLFLLSVSEPEEPDHDDERLGGTSKCRDFASQRVE